MKVQVFSVHQFPVQTSSVINQHTKGGKKKPTKKTEVGRKRSGLPQLSFLYNMLKRIDGDRLTAFFLMSHLKSQYTCCVLLPHPGTSTQQKLSTVR